MKVVDASVVLKWILAEESGRETAKALIPNHASGTQEIVVHDLLFYEVTNILAISTRLPLAQIEEILDWLYELELKVTSLGRDDFKNAAKLAQEFHISVYDASYVALAISLDAVFVTADIALTKRLPEKLIRTEQI